MTNINGERNIVKEKDENIPLPDAAFSNLSRVCWFIKQLAKHAFNHLDVVQLKLPFALTSTTEVPFIKGCCLQNNTMSMLVIDPRKQVTSQRVAVGPLTSITNLKKPTTFCEMMGPEALLFWLLYVKNWDNETGCILACSS